MVAGAGGVRARQRRHEEPAGGERGQALLVFHDHHSSISPTRSGRSLPALAGSRLSQEGRKKWRTIPWCRRGSRWVNNRLRHPDGAREMGVRADYGWIWRAQLKGPKEVALLPLAPGSMVSFSHSSGKVLPWTTMRWKFATS